MEGLRCARGERRTCWTETRQILDSICGDKPGYSPAGQAANLSSPSRKPKRSPIPPLLRTPGPEHLAGVSFTSQTSFKLKVVALQPPRDAGVSLPSARRPRAAEEVNFCCRSLPATLSRLAECVSSGKRRRRRRRRRRDGSSSPAAFSYGSCCSASWQLRVLPAKEQLKQEEIT